MCERRAPRQGLGWRCEIGSREYVNDIYSLDISGELREREYTREMARELKHVESGRER